MSKKARSEGSRVAGLIKANKAEYYIADLDLEDDSNDVTVASEVVTKTLGKHKAAFLLISAGIKCITVAIGIPDGFDKFDGKLWLNESIKNIAGDRVDLGANAVVITADTPFKLKDMVRSAGFEYLNKVGCMGDESSEEFVGFDGI
jgi:hypothetical protein